MQDTFPMISSLKMSFAESGIVIPSAAKTYSDMVAVASQLHETIVKQQLMINFLLLKQQQNQQKFNLASFATHSQELSLKFDMDALMSNDKFPSQVEVASEGSEATAEDKDNKSESKMPQIIRRNGFKALGVNNKIKKDDFSDSDADSTCPSKKEDKIRKNPSKAKHLWVNYGRRIIEYGISQTKGELQERIKQLVGKLNSKKDFESVFQNNAKDCADDKAFKSLLGKLAIHFVKNKSVISFEGSKYKEEMITQRHVVAAWIERLISE